MPNTGKRTKPQFFKMTCVTYFADFVFLSLPCAASEVFVSFLFLRNTFHFSGVHSKCDVCRAPHHSEMGKTLQNKCFKRKILKCPQSFRECCAMKAVSTFLDKSCQKCWFSAKFWIWALVAAFFPFEIFYYWCAQIQASNFMSFPKRTLKSEKFHVDLGVKICWPALFCVGFLTTTVQK